ncbi:hypothetical protein OOK36_55340 [Streptomyces sp. NBC_00365]|uniref:hypothetical protein n=1 Tax=Streptomyces sp. NBC_00365 TaxID=2975726 RepID=UPI00224FE0DC|nr:hypothetical protein [Streptomyces sp. NBC_00365]MCX5097630.1 hypothetical protein [Streptomyces sp. NBC_00365]
MTAIDNLAHHVAYVDDTLPAVLAGRAPTPAPRAAAAPVPPPAHRAGPARPAPAARPAPVPVPAAAPETDWWRSAPRPSWGAVTTPSPTRR